MSKGVILHLDNDLEGVLEPSKHLFDQYDFDIDYIICTTKDDFKNKVSENKDRIKALIFDLLSEEPTSGEINEGDAKFLEDIEKGIADYNIPVFVYSGYLEGVATHKFNNMGTVFLIDKGTGFQPIINKFKLLDDSGFIDLFCPNGLLENEIHRELNKAFICQFKNNDEIEHLINQITGEDVLDSTRKRISKVLRRIALRTLLAELLAPEVDEQGDIVDEELSSLEHYLRRGQRIKIWTGDIFKTKNGDNYIFILTPRCNVLRDDNLLVCPFELYKLPEKDDKLRKFLTGDPQVSGYNRYIPPSPIFEGGVIKLSKYFMLSKKEISDNYNLIISLSDELTNEILGKFGSYFFRTGINPWNAKEVRRQILISEK